MVVGRQEMRGPGVGFGERRNRASKNKALHPHLPPTIISLPRSTQSSVQEVSLVP